MRDDTPQEMRDKQETGQKIRRFRDERGLSQLQLAELMGTKYTRKAVSSFETGSDHMRIGALFAVCDIFGVSPEEPGPERLLSEQNEFLAEYRSLNLKNRETLKSFLGYLKNQQESGAADTGKEHTADLPNDNGTEERRNQTGGTQ